MSKVTIKSITVQAHPEDAGKAVGLIAYEEQRELALVEFPIPPHELIAGISRYQSGRGPVKDIAQAFPNLSPTYQTLLTHWAQ